jgi:hypothetical protein
MIVKKCINENKGMNRFHNEAQKMRTIRMKMHMMRII